jgi:DNA-binding transcriptional regulator LsrR (DeoR family)
VDAAKDAKLRASRQAAEGAAAPLSLDRDHQAATRAAWLYYVEGLTQDQIARRLGLNRIRVNRILAQARESGIVQIRINGRLAECVALEARLVDRFGLSRAIVVPTPEDPELIPQAIAVEAGYALSESIRPDTSVGIGWGRTLRLSLRSVESRTIPGLSIVSLLGGLTRGSVLNAYETAFHLADLFEAECYYIAAPVFADTGETRDLLMRQDLVRNAIERARAADVALVSVGSLSDASTMVRLGLITLEDARELREAGAVGDLCGTWIARDGSTVDHPLNQRVLGVAPRDLGGIDAVILASGGPDKTDVLHGALSLGVVDTLVTDAQSAERLLADGPGRPAGLAGLRRSGA